MNETGIGIVDVTLDVAQALLPLVVFFLVFQLLFLRYPWYTLRKILLGTLITGLGMILFLSGVYMGFMPVAKELGEHLAYNYPEWIIILFGLLMGFLSTYAEPAVRVLCGQVEESSGGYISERLLLWILSFGVAAAVGLGTAKIVYAIDFRLIIIIGYVIALIMMMVSDSRFVAIAFDAGGVATGPMAVSMIMTMAVGMASGIEGGNPIIDGFGIIALIALTPILFVLGLGILIPEKEV